MKKEYNLKELKKRPGAAKTSSVALKVATSIRLEGHVLGALKTEAMRMGIPYQTLIGSVLHRYVAGELIDKQTITLAKKIKNVT